MKIEKLDCRKCIHYYITWDVNFPYGCRLFKLKSKQLPSAIVFESLGTKCDNFLSKTKGEA